MNINIGVIGTGLIGLIHLFSLKQIKEENLISKNGVNINIKQIADIDENKLNKLKKNNPYNVERFTTNPEELIYDNSIDIIYIATPTKFHKEFFCKAAEEGKNIFCEKPIAFSLDDIKEMISYEKKYGILTQTGLVLRYCPIFWKFKEILLDKNLQFGERLSFIFRDTQEWPLGTQTHPSEWRKDPSLAYAGCLYEHGIHDVDLLNYLFNEEAEISKLKAKIRYVSQLTQGSIEDVAILNIEYLDGFSGNLIGIWNNARMDERRFEISFENGFLILDGYTGFSLNKFEYLIKKKKKRFTMKDVTIEYMEAKNFPKTTSNLGPYLYENLSFLNSVLNEEKPYPGLEIGYKAHNIIELAYQSSKENIIINFN